MDSHVELAARYNRQPWVVGSELRNEVRNSVINDVWHVPQWGGGGPNDWHAAATRAGSAILHVNPQLLVFVGGMSYQKDLRGVYHLPVKLSIPNRLVYAAHGYSWTYPGLPNTYEALKAELGRLWGYIAEPDKPYTAPVWISEFGTFNDCRKESCSRWWPDFVRYLSEGDFDWAVWQGDGTNSRSSGLADQGHVFNTATNYGLLSPDWRRPAQTGELMAALKTIQHPSLGPGVVPRRCSDHCEDNWDPGWPDMRRDMDACSLCLHKAQCRKNLTIEAWCGGPWAAHRCGRTCCQSGLLAPGACASGSCAHARPDAWGRPDGRADGEACLACIRDPACRQLRSEAEWCAGDTGSGHCQLTCCMSGFPPARNLLV